MFYGRNISRLFDLKGSLRGRFTQRTQQNKTNVNSNNNNVDLSSSDNANETRRHSFPDDDNSSIEESDDGSNSYYSSSTSSSGVSEDDSDDENIPNVSPRKKDEVVNEDVQQDNRNEEPNISTYLDGDFIEFTAGHPLPLNDRAKAVFHMSILNVSLLQIFYSIIILSIYIYIYIYFITSWLPIF